MTSTPRNAVILAAAGGLARETAAAARASGLVVVGCLDDRTDLRGREVAAGLPVLGGIDDVTDHPDLAVVICAGKGSSRAVIAQRLDRLGLGEERYATIVHPSVSLPDDVVVGQGSILLAGVVLTSTVTLGRHVVCMPNAVLTHDCRVADFATLCAAVVLGGGAQIGQAPTSAWPHRFARDDVSVTGRRSAWVRWFWTTCRTVRPGSACRPDGWSGRASTLSAQRPETTPSG